MRHRQAVEQELDREVGSYLQLLTEEKVRAGMDRSSAHRAALIELEGMQQVKEKVREARTGAWLDQFAQDVRYGLRLLRKNPGFAAIAVLTLALGIGANSAIFSVLYEVMLKPLPYSKPQQVVRILQSLHSSDRLGITQEQMVALRSDKGTFNQVGSYFFGTAFVKGPAQTDQALIARVTAGTLETLGVQPMLGHGFVPDDEIPNGAQVAILSYKYWQDRYHGDRGVLGQSINVNDFVYTIVGVLPPDFVLPDEFVGGRSAELWLPLRIDKSAPDFDLFGLQTVARLAPGMNPTRALSHIRLTFGGLFEMHGFGTQKLQQQGWDVRDPLVHDDLVGDVRTAMWVLAGAVGVVLLIVCANVASLLLARASSRRREIAVRVAMGAQPQRIIRQLLTESLIISLLGGAFGLGLASAGLRLVVRLGADNVPRLAEVGLNLPVLLFTLATCLLATMMFGLAPAWRASRSHLKLNQSLREEERGSSSGGHRGLIQSTLVIAEVGSAVVLVVCAGLLLRSFSRLLQIDPGFRVNNVLTVQINLPGSRYPTGKPINNFWTQMIARTQTLPGVISAAATSLPPLNGQGGDTGFDAEGRAESIVANHLYYWVVTPDYFKTLGVALQQGRGLQPQDVADAPLVVVINDVMARRIWPNENPVGKHLRIYTAVTTKGPWAEVVGVAKSVAMRKLNEEPVVEAFFPMAQGDKIGTGASVNSSLVVRTASADPLGLVAAIREQARQVDSSAAVAQALTAQQIVDETVSQPHFNLVLLGLFAGVALVLAAVGIYGILANMVRQRTREIGIRLALGAQRSDIFRLIVGRGMVLAASGLLLGVSSALGATRLLVNLLFGVKPTDPQTFAAVVVLLGLVAMLACYIPARRAMRVDPMVTLRYE
ncbi:MAG TPA: ABC transporter permease [Alphaproteobacteria bacterium]|nr:ABC transporter permease [Alphaproteobacteria bacterium]